MPGMDRAGAAPGTRLRAPARPRGSPPACRDRRRSWPPPWSWRAHRHGQPGLGADRASDPLGGGAGRPVDTLGAVQVEVRLIDRDRLDRGSEALQERPHRARRTAIQVRAPRQPGRMRTATVGLADRHSGVDPEGPRLVGGGRQTRAPCPPRIRADDDGPPMSAEPAAARRPRRTRPDRRGGSRGCSPVRILDKNRWSNACAGIPSRNCARRRAALRRPVDPPVDHPPMPVHALLRDLFFRSRIEATAKAAGVPVMSAARSEELLGRWETRRAEPYSVDLGGGADDWTEFGAQSTRSAL